MKCAYCGKALPEEGFTKYPVATGILAGMNATCMACVHRLKLKIVGLSDRPT